MARRKQLIRAGTKVDEMVRSIADSIVTGILHPGARLDEASLAARFEVSRTPVREALRQLGAMGLIDREPNRGAMVSIVTQEHLLSMFESMAELEAICARFSAERMKPAERRALETEHQSSAKLVYLGAHDAYEEHNIDFHSRLYDGAHSKHVKELALLTRSRLAPFRRAQFRIPGRLEKSWIEHDAIVRAILRGDGEAAGQAARAHVSIVGKTSTIFTTNGGSEAARASSLIERPLSTDPSSMGVPRTNEPA